MDKRLTDAQIESMIPAHLSGLNRRIAKALIIDKRDHPEYAPGDFPAMNFGVDPQQRLVRIGTAFALDVAVGITVVRICDLKKMVAQILLLEAEEEARARPADTAALQGKGTGIGLTVQ